MSKARKGHMLPTPESLFWGLPSYEQRLTFTRKKQAVLRTTRKSVSFLFEVTICMVPCSETIGGKQFYPLMSRDPEIISVSKSNILMLIILEGKIIVTYKCNFTLFLRLLSCSALISFSFSCSRSCRISSYIE